MWSQVSLINLPVPDKAMGWCQEDNESLLKWWTRDHSVYVPSQWEMVLHCNTISHWLGAYTEWSLMIKISDDSRHHKASLSWGWLLTSEALWHSPESNMTASAPAPILYNEFENFFKITATSLWDQALSRWKSSHSIKYCMWWEM